MEQFIQSLEQRTFLSATLLMDRSAITADAAGVKTAVKSLVSQNKVLLAAITVDLKTLPKTNAPLLKTVSTDASALAKATTKDQNAIITPSSKLAASAVNAGDNLLNSWSLKSVTTVDADSTSLNSIIVAPLGQLQLDLTGPLVTNLGIILSANPTATQLASDINALDAGYAAAAAQLTGAATQYQSGLGTLASDLGSITAIPNIVFNYTGKVTDTSPGKKHGKSFKAEFDITTEAANGTFTATYTDESKAIPTSQGATGSVDSSGDFSAMLDDGSTLAGTISGKRITGTVDALKFLGTFSVSHP